MAALSALGTSEALFPEPICTYHFPFTIIVAVFIAVTNRPKDEPM